MRLRLTFRTHAVAWPVFVCFLFLKSLSRSLSISLSLFASLSFSLSLSLPPSLSLNLYNPAELQTGAPRTCRPVITFQNLYRTSQHPVSLLPLAPVALLRRLGPTCDNPDPPLLTGLCLCALLPRHVPRTSLLSVPPVSIPVPIRPAAVVPSVTVSVSVTIAAAVAVTSSACMHAARHTRHTHHTRHTRHTRRTRPRIRRSRQVCKGVHPQFCVQEANVRTYCAHICGRVRALR